MKCISETLSGCCGVSHLSEFSREDFWNHKQEIKDGVLEIGGAGWVVAGFIDSAACREAYLEMCDRFNLVYQTPVRQNLNTDNWFFFAVFDAEKAEKALQPSFTFPKDEE